MEDRATLESDPSASRGLAGRQRLNIGAAVFIAKAAALENQSDKLIPRASRISDMLFTAKEHQYGENVKSGKAAMEL